MSPLRQTRGRPPGGVTPVATGLAAAALVLLTTLLPVRAPALVTARNIASDVCPPPPVPAAGSCTSTTSTTSSTRSSTQSSSTESTATTGTQTDTGTTSTSTGSTATTSADTTTPALSGSSTRPAAGPSASPTPSRFPPPPPPLPPLPPPAPGSVPVAPETVVQRIVMVPAVSGPIAPGDTVEVQAILEAQRGTDIYAVPHVPVIFAIVSAAGGGASVSPTRVSSGDTGVAMARVRTGDAAGDTVVSATSGTAGAQLALHAELPVAGAAARVAPPATPGAASRSDGGHRVALIGVLVALGILGALSLGMLRRRADPEP